MIELSYDIFEKILISMKFDTKEEIKSFSDKCLNRAERDGVELVIIEAFKEAHHKISLLSVEQLKEIQKIVCDE